MSLRERKLTKDHIIEMIGLAWIILSFGVCLYVNTKSLRFWVDEGMLAYSVSNRSLAELAATPLDWNQSTPILYLYIVKIISMLLGNSEFTLRLFSLISYAVLLDYSMILSRIFSVIDIRLWRQLFWPAFPFSWGMPRSSSPI